MENGVNVDASLSGDRMNSPDGVLELKEADKVLLGSHHVKGSEGDEVFEEAVGSETPLAASETPLAATEVRNSIEHERAEDDLKGSDNFDSHNDDEKFEETIEDLADMGSKLDVLVNEDSPVTQESSPLYFAEDKMIGLEIYGMVKDQDNEVKKGEDVVSFPESRNSLDEQGAETATDVLTNPENRGLDHSDTVILDSLETGDDDRKEDCVPKKLEVQDINEVKGGEAGSIQHSESNGDALHQDEKDVCVGEFSGILENGHQHEIGNTSSTTTEFHEHNVVNQIDPVKLDTDRKCNKIIELGNKESASLEPINQDSDSEDQKDAIVNGISASEPRGEGAEMYVEDSIPNSDVGGSHLDDTTVEIGATVVSPDMTEATTASLPQPTDVGIDEPEKKECVYEQLNQNIPENIEQEARLATDVLSSSNLSPTPASPTRLTLSNGELGTNSSSTNAPSVTPAHPAGLGSTAPLSRPTPEIPSSSSQSASHSTPARPAGLGRTAPLLEPAPRAVQQSRVNGAVPPVQNQLIEDSANGEPEEYDETREKLQMIRVKFLRLAHRLGQTPHNVVVAQVLYRLGLAEQLRGRNGGRVAAFSFDRASAMAEQLEATGQGPLDFSCTIMVLGKTGVGKSATINSIFDEVKFDTDAFQLGTKRVQDVVGMVHGIKVRVIDTPGLLPSWSDQRHNEKILHSVKRFMKKTPPDIVLYLDRLDTQSRDFGDMPLLRTITEIFGQTIWFNAIVVLTHAASAPPEGPNGTATSYDMFVTQRSHVVQQAIRQAAGDMRLMNPVSLVENHSACRTNRAGQRVLPNGQVWKPHLLLLSFASKILAEANLLLKLQDSPPGRPFATRARSPPLPFLLLSLLQSRPQVKLPTEQFGDDDEALDDDLDQSSDSEDELDYDDLPPFRPLTKVQLEKLSKAQKKAYFDEMEYREKHFTRKQLREDRKRRKMIKKMQAEAKELPTSHIENVEEDSGGAASVPVPLPDIALPASFDSDNPSHRYRCLDSNQWLVRPVLDSNGWDHDVGYEGVNVDRLIVVKDVMPISFSGQITKDKKDTSLQMEIASSLKHGDGKATSLGFDMQSVGKDIAYTLRSETRFSNYRRNKATAGFSLTLLGDVMTGGVKVEDKLIVNRRGQVVVSGGAIMGRGDVAYGGSLEATLRDKDHPYGRFSSTFGLSVMDWHGDLAIGCNTQTQIPVGRHTNLIARFNVNNKGSGQVSIRLNSSEQLQIALVSLIPLARKLLGNSQPSQFGY